MKPGALHASYATSNSDTAEARQCKRRTYTLRATRLQRKRRWSAVWICGYVHSVNSSVSSSVGSLVGRMTRSLRHEHRRRWFKACGTSLDTCIKRGVRRRSDFCEMAIGTDGSRGRCEASRYRTTWYTSVRKREFHDRLESSVVSTYSKLLRGLRQCPEILSDVVEVARNLWLMAPPVRLNSKIPWSKHIKHAKSEPVDLTNSIGQNICS